MVSSSLLFLKEEREIIKSRYRRASRRMDYLCANNADKNKKGENMENTGKPKACSDCGIEVVGNNWCKPCLDRINKEIDSELADSRIYVNKKCSKKYNCDKKEK